MLLYRRRNKLEGKIVHFIFDSMQFFLYCSSKESEKNSMHKTLGHAYILSLEEWKKERIPFFPAYALFYWNVVS